MSSRVCRPAAIVKQGTLDLYATSLRVRDLLMPGFYDIERLDPDDPTDLGYQRVLNKGRAKKLADYLTDGHKERDAFLPTSIFLATDKAVSFDSASNTLSFDVAVVGPFSVVDGQHRLEGLRLAAEKSPDLLDFEVPVNIGVGLSKIAQMCHFLIVNTTQKSVDKSVEQRIYARLTSAVQVENVPSLPRWIRRIVESGDDEQALRIADYLNETEGSAWYQKIEMANEDAKTATISQRSFVKAVKRYILTANNPVREPADRLNRIMFNYWKAVANRLDVGKPTVLFKYNGVELFSRFAVPFFNHLASGTDYRVGTMEAALAMAFENLNGQYSGVGHPTWWLSGNEASSQNAAALTKINTELVRALHQATTSGGELQV
jgi:DGQHR domain-containing protein